MESLWTQSIAVRTFTSTSHWMYVDALRGDRRVTANQSVLETLYAGWLLRLAGDP